MTRPLPIESLKKKCTTCSCWSGVRKIVTVNYKPFYIKPTAGQYQGNDCLTIFDVEHCILTGRIIERQKDKATGEPKYRIHGQALSGTKIEVITKLSRTGNLVIITVYVA